MVTMLGKVLCYLRLHCRPVIDNDLLSLHNAIQCGRSWQPGRRCGSAILVSAVEAFTRVVLRAEGGDSPLIDLYLHVTY